VCEKMGGAMKATFYHGSRVHAILSFGSGTQTMSGFRQAFSRGRTASLNLARRSANVGESAKDSRVAPITV